MSMTETSALPLTPQTALRASREAGDDYAVVRRAIAFISEQWRSQPDVTAIAHASGVTPDGLHNLFRRWAGLTPKAFMAAITLDHARRLLREEASVLDTAYAVGLSGPGRLHDLFVTHEAMSPGEWKAGGKGLTLAYGFHVSPFGDALIIATDRGLAGLAFADPGQREHALADMQRRWPRAQFREEAARIAPLARRIFDPAQWREERPLRVVMIGTDFEVRVWETLLKIPMGRLTTYSDIARKLDAPKGARAVGAAVGKNPLAFVVPCHRVIGKSGDLTGYHWGLTRKRAILGWEAGRRGRGVRRLGGPQIAARLTIPAPSPRYGEYAVRNVSAQAELSKWPILVSLKDIDMQKRRPVMLVIMDGWGWREEPADNAVLQARTPVFDRLWSTCPRAFLRTSGRDVGLPDGQMGNSEVGHLNIGAGRVVMQDLPRISDAIATGAVARAPALSDLIARLRQSGGTCHLMGLVSPGGVHSHQHHLAALARIIAEAGIPAVIHAFTDGRDTPPRMAATYLEDLIGSLPPSVSVATVCGRYYAMDRDKRWDRVTRACDALVDAEGAHFPDAHAAMADAYAHDITDEFVPPAVIGGYRGMKDGDGVLCFNFRADRVREILGALIDPQFSGFKRKRTVRLAAAVGMTPYSKDLDAFMQPLFPPQDLSHVLGEVVAAAGRTQLRMAETEKYAHVTYFLNGGREEPYRSEDRIMVPSPKVATYDLQPEMSAPELTQRAVEAIRSGKYDLIVLNYANPDMVGHTGSLPAAVKAVETVDAGIGELTRAIGDAGGALLITADHGNCELMRDPETGGPHTAHTTNPVPLLLTGAGDVALTEGRLADLAPTLLDLMDVPKPADMTGTSLIRPQKQAESGRAATAGAYG